jgi:lysylphosphatidylglycerol synthetase-like protein (DUF2156 family)
VRPTGITVLAVLYGIGGILGLVSGVMSLNIVSIIPSLLNLAIAYGLWKGMSWSWWLTLIFSILGIIAGVLILACSSLILALMPKAIALIAGSVIAVMGILTIVLNAVIVYYITRPHVKDFFGI